jgi:hypothetical protein
MTTTNTPTIAQLVAAGGREWTHPSTGAVRVYFSDVCALAGWEVHYYGTGRISSALYRGAPVSNSRAAREMPTHAKLWFEAGRFHATNLSDADREHAIAAILARVGG